MIASAIAFACRLMTGAVVQWHFEPITGRQRIYFSNHASHLDFVVIWSSLPPMLRRLTRPVAGGDYWRTGVVRPYLASRIFRAVLIDRLGSGASNVAATRASLEQMLSAIDGGSSLIVFPEGTRSRDGEVGPFKSGLYHLAQARPGVELVPVYLENLNRILPKGEFLPVPMLSRITFGAPVVSDRDDDKRTFLTRARDAVIQLRSAA